MNDSIFIAVIVTLIFYIFYTKRKGKSKQLAIKNEDSIAVSLIINKSLEMSTGKIIAQLGHALFNVVSTFYQKKDLYEGWKQSNEEIQMYEATAEELKSLSTVLHKHNIGYNKIIDAGRTQIPSGSNTILIVGPGKANEITGLLSHLSIF